jgi:hypothetical protein
MAGKSLLLHGLTVPVDHVLGPTAELAFAKPASSRLLTLLAEIRHNIFSPLDVVSSTCLGLTCKAFYPLHEAHYGIVTLDIWHRRSSPEFEVCGGVLGLYPANWAGARIYSTSGWPRDS